jgi:hypothetical protein
MSQDAASFFNKRSLHSSQVCECGLPLWIRYKFAL